MAHADQAAEILATANLGVVYAGRDWRDAGVRGAYCCAVIRDADDFAIVTPMIDSDQAYFASAERKAGQSWYQHDGYGKLFGSAEDVAREMAAQFAHVLDSKDDITFYSDSDIESRDRSLAAYPALEDESESDHATRVAGLLDDGCLAAPLYVNEAGYWDCNDQYILLSATQMNIGVWSFEYDDRRQSVIAVLIDRDAEAEED